MKEGPRAWRRLRPGCPAAPSSMMKREQNAEPAIPIGRRAPAIDPSPSIIDRFSVVLVAIAATMWASDTYFRAQLIGHLTPSEIVVIEDGLITLFLLVFLVRGIPEMR